MPGLQERGRRQNASYASRHAGSARLGTGERLAALWLDGCLCMPPGRRTENGNARHSTVAGRGSFPSFWCVSVIRGKGVDKGRARRAREQGCRASNVRPVRGQSYQLDDKLQASKGIALGLVEMPRERSDVASLSRVQDLECTFQSSALAALGSPQPKPLRSYPRMLTPAGHLVLEGQVLVRLGGVTLCIHFRWIRRPIRTRTGASLHA